MDDVVLGLGRRDDSPEIFLEAKALCQQTRVQLTQTSSTRRSRRRRCSKTRSRRKWHWSRWVPKVMTAVEELAQAQSDCTVVEGRSLITLDTAMIAADALAIGRLSSLGGLGLCGFVVQLAFMISGAVYDDLDGPIVRTTSTVYLVSGHERLGGYGRPLSRGHRQEVNEQTVLTFVTGRASFNRRGALPEIRLVVERRGESLDHASRLRRRNLADI